MYWRSCSNTTLVGAWSLGWSQVIHRCMGPHVWYHNIIKLPTRCCLVCSWHVDIVSVWPVGFETKKSASAACSISSRHKGGSRPKGGCSGHPPAGYPAGDGSSSWRRPNSMAQPSVHWPCWAKHPGFGRSDEKVGGLDGPLKLPVLKKTSKWGIFFPASKQ